MDRRDFLRGGALALAASLAPRRVLGDGTLLRHVASPQDLATPLEYLDRLITPTDVFFVRSHFGPPALDPARKVRVEGDAVLELGVEDLKAFPEVTVTAVLQCAGNGRALQRPRVPGVQWGHGAMGQATFTGVRLADVLARAGVPPDALWVHTEGWDRPPMPTTPRFLRALTVGRALDPSTLLAYRMNGAPLTLAHGAPLRLVVPGLPGDEWTKWVRTIRLSADEPEGFYWKTAYRYPTHPVEPGAAVPPAEMRPVGRLPVRSVIARPLDGARLRAGRAEVAGIAFSGFAPIDRVEVSVDGGARWTRAALQGDAAPGRWQVFRAPFEVRTPGRYAAVARAFDARGNAQPQAAAWNPSGYLWNAWHVVGFEVIA
jgi:DMSO/TMAO reductase YedYZ molybdopterin-dependent catalytic subunit